MKFNKILITIFVLFVFASIISMNVFADDTDYNSVIGINVDGENVFYSKLGLTVATWEDYVNAYNELNSDSPFGILSGYVTYLGNFLLDRNNKYVLPNFDLTAAAGGVYKVTPICVLNNNTFTIDTRIDSNTLFRDFVKNSKHPEFKISEQNGNMYVFYDSNYIVINRVTIKEDQNIGSNVVYTLEKECYHDFVLKEIIEPASCVEKGIRLLYCRFCQSEITEDIPTSEGFHSLITDSYLVATCTATGYESKHCTLCDYTEYVVIDRLGHSYTEATCTENGQCTRCGALKIALGHKLNALGNCKRDGCGYSKFSTWWQNNVSDPVNNGVENAKDSLTNIKDNFTDWLDNKKDEASDAGDDIKQFFKIFVLIISGAFIIVVFVTVLPYVIKFFDFLKNRTNTKGRKK